MESLLYASPERVVHDFCNPDGIVDWEVCLVHIVPTSWKRISTARALLALDQDRLLRAWPFSGKRGLGLRILEGSGKKIIIIAWIVQRRYYSVLCTYILHAYVHVCTSICTGVDSQRVGLFALTLE